VLRACLFAFTAVVTSGVGYAGDWNPESAAHYLDTRAAQWAEWKRAAREGGACISCHTSLGYLMARPALRTKLAESTPTEFETGLLAGARTRVGSSLQQTDVTKDNTPVVTTALVLALDDQRRGALSSETEGALRLMWATQHRDGTLKGAWGWTDANLEPWEVQESPFFGAALAAVAAGGAPGDYLSRPDIQGNIADLKAYLRAGHEHQPLANRLLLLWANVEMPGLVPDSERKTIIESTFAAQSEDGGWKLALLGPWRDRSDAPDVPAGSSAYATAWTVSMLERAGVKDERIEHGRRWLRQNQSPEGYWEAVSMNKKYEPGSMQQLFMRDAATAWAVLALTER
jgi:squalene-hopene/tetraprenyl-beta-curcumene cyclase